MSDLQVPLRSVSITDFKNLSAAIHYLLLSNRSANVQHFARPSRFIFCKNVYSTKVEYFYKIIVRVRIMLTDTTVLLHRSSPFRHKHQLELSRIWGYHGGEYEDGCLLGCSAVQSGRSLPTFQRSLLPPSPGYCSQEEEPSCIFVWWSVHKTYGAVSVALLTHPYAKLY
jgi:hypothetical protein